MHPTSVSKFDGKLENLKGSGAHAGWKSPGGRVAECHSTYIPST